MFFFFISICVALNHQYILLITMATFTVMTFNLDSEHDDRDLSQTMCYDIVSCVTYNSPDIIGFQNADSNIGLHNDEDIKQNDLADELKDLDLIQVMFDAGEIVQARQKKNLIGFDNTRYNLIAHGTDLIRWLDELQHWNGRTFVT